MLEKKNPAPAFVLVARTLVLHTGISGFSSQLSPLTPAACYHRPWEAAGGGSSHWIPATMWETWIEFLLVVSEREKKHIASFLSIWSSE